MISTKTAVRGIAIALAGTILVNIFISKLDTPSAQPRKANEAAHAHFEAAKRLNEKDSLALAGSTPKTTMAAPKALVGGFCPDSPRP